VRCPQLVQGEHPDLFWGQGLRRIELCWSQGVSRYGWFVGLGVVVASYIVVDGKDVAGRGRELHG